MSIIVKSYIAVLLPSPTSRPKGGLQGWIPLTKSPTASTAGNKPIFFGQVFNLCQVVYHFVVPIILVRNYQFTEDHVYFKAYSHDATVTAKNVLKKFDLNKSAFRQDAYRPPVYRFLAYPGEWGGCLPGRKGVDALARHISPSDQTPPPPDPPSPPWTYRCL